MNHASKSAAFFDFDGTISSKDSFLAFIEFTHGKLRLYIGLLKHTAYILFYYCKQYPNDKLKEKVFSYFYQGWTEDELGQYGVDFSQKILPKICYSAAIDRIQWHQAQGHDIYLLTASSDIWLGKWCRNLGIKCVGTEFEVIDETYTGKIRGENCYGKEKVVRIAHLLPTYEKTYGYGDSEADRFFLELMDIKYWGAIETG